ncbi:hypothetical protein D3C87_1937070 [compost metagenome]
MPDLDRHDLCQHHRRHEQQRQNGQHDDDRTGKGESPNVSHPIGQILKELSLFPGRSVHPGSQGNRPDTENEEK